MSTRSVLEAFEERQERIVSSFKLSMISVTTAIVLLRRAFATNPPRPGQTMDIANVDELTGERSDLGSLPASPQTIQDLTAHKQHYIRHSISELSENFTYFLEDLYEDLCAQLWSDRNDMDLFISYVRQRRGEPDTCLSAFKSIGCPTTLITSVKDRTKLPLELRHLWTHRGTILDEIFFQRIGRNAQSECVLSFLGVDRDISLGNEFPLRQADVQDCASLLSEVCTDLVGGINNT